MSKLDGNERWKSKMLLAEHQEQYENRHQKNSPKRPTEEELIMIRDYILLPYMLTMVQKSINDIEITSTLLKPLYLAVGRAVTQKMSEDLYSLRRELSRRHIKIISDEQVDMIMYHRLICRGYEDRFGMVRDVMKSEISIRLSKYFKEIIHRLTKNEH